MAGLVSFSNGRRCTVPTSASRSRGRSAQRSSSTSCARITACPPQSARKRHVFGFWYRRLVSLSSSALCAPSKASPSRPSKHRAKTFLGRAARAVVVEMSAGKGIRMYRRSMTYGILWYIAGPGHLWGMRAAGGGDCCREGVRRRRLKARCATAGRRYRGRGPSAGCCVSSLSRRPAAFCATGNCRTCSSPEVAG